MASLKTLRDRCLIDPDTECWIWTQCTQGNGYGRIRFDGKTHYVHRVAYKLAFGPAPEGRDICHRCENRRCCNPAHLFAGTRLQNMRDAASKGRLSRGHRHAATTIGHCRARGKLSMEKARAIRKLRAEGQRTDSLAHQFGVDVSTIRLVVAGKIWREARWIGAWA